MRPVLAIRTLEHGGMMGGWTYDIVITEQHLTEDQMVYRASIPPGDVLLAVVNQSARPRGIAQRR
jgi:hypothetical protein